MGEFSERIDELKQLIGEGTCTGEVTRDQVYAHYQEANLQLRHPHGGKAMYQESTLYDKVSTYLHGIAEHVLADGPNAGMAEAMESFAGDSGQACPKDLTLLAHSDHPTVTSNGELVYDRAPEVPRLSAAELRELHHGSGDHPYTRVRA